MHEVLRVLAGRARAGSQPGRRDDGFRVALAVEGGAMRGTISAGMALALDELGLVTAFDAVYGASAGAITAAWLLSRPQGLLGWTEPVYARAFIRRTALLRGRPVADVRTRPVRVRPLPHRPGPGRHARAGAAFPPRPGGLPGRTRPVPFGPSDHPHHSAPREPGPARDLPVPRRPASRRRPPPSRLSVRAPGPAKRLGCDLLHPPAGWLTCGRPAGHRRSPAPRRVRVRPCRHARRVGPFDPFQPLTPAVQPSWCRGAHDHEHFWALSDPNCS
jgi:hypothetical protein